MPDDLRLDPARSHRGAVALAQAGRAMAELGDRLGAGVAAGSAGPPWGRDDIGAAFEPHYRGFEQAVLAAWQTIGSYVEGLGMNAADAVAGSVGTDAGAGRRIGDTRV